MTLRWLTKTPVFSGCLVIPETTGNDRKQPKMTGNDRKQPETTGNDMKEDGCSSVCLYSLIIISLLALVTNANRLFKCVCRPTVYDSPIYQLEKDRK